jgi:WD40 repeat protein
VIAAFDKITRVWYLADRLRMVAPGPATGTDTGSSTALSPDGRRQATVAADGGSVRVQDTASGAEIAVLPAPEGDRMHAVSFTPDSRWVVTETAAGAVIRWRCFSSTEELVAYARAHMPRQLTAEERTRFLLE